MGDLLVDFLLQRVDSYNDPENVKCRDLTIEGLVEYETVTGEVKEFEKISFTTFVEDSEDFQIMLEVLKGAIVSRHRGWNSSTKRWRVSPLLPTYERYLCQIFPNFNGAITGARTQQMFPGWERRLAKP